MYRSMVVFLLAITIAHLTLFTTAMPSSRPLARGNLPQTIELRYLGFHPYKQSKSSVAFWEATCKGFDERARAGILESADMSRWSIPPADGGDVLGEFEWKQTERPVTPAKQGALGKLAAAGANACRKIVGGKDKAADGTTTNGKTNCNADAAATKDVDMEVVWTLEFVTEERPRRGAASCRSVAVELLQDAVYRYADAHSGGYKNILSCQFEDRPVEKWDGKDMYDRMLGYV